MLPLPGFDGMKALYAIMPDEWCWRLQPGRAYFLVILVLAVLLHPGAMDLALVPVHFLADHAPCCTVAEATGRPSPLR